MWYDKQHVPVLTSQEWYQLLAKEYAQFHKRLHVWDRGLVERFLPRKLTWLAVLDIWWGDGRMASHFVDSWVSEYRIIDSAPALLARAPRWTQQQVMDITQPWQLEHAYDIMLCFFVLVHIQDLTTLFDSITQWLAPGWRCIVLHHLERDGYLHTVGGKSFKIQTRYHSFAHVEQIAQRAWLSCDSIDYAELGEAWSILYCFYRS
jgi:2-polyprenyl-3-methyl-5-hydroxy-6-metoxy-1,4-benzoquinol methylase